MRKKVPIIWAVLLLVSMTGCSIDTESPEDTSTIVGEKPVELVYYTVGSPDQDLEMVNEKLNEMLLEKLGITVKYIKIPFEDYEERLSQLISSGSKYDIIFAYNGYAQYALQDTWLALDDYLSTVGAEMYEAIDDAFWNGVNINGSIYGVPTNKELGVPEQWMFPTELLEKHNIDIAQYDTLESLGDIFEVISEKEPEYLVMELNKNSHNFFAMYGYEYVTEKNLPLMVQSLSDDPQIVSIFETEEARHILDTLRQYYQAGYINQDAATLPSGELAPRKVFFSQASGGLYADVTWSQNREYAVTAFPVTDTIITNESTRAGVMAVNASTKYPEECVAFLNCLNTDPEVRNLLNYGIEDVHYTLSDEEQVIKEFPATYEGVQYSQGNWFILHTQQGEPLDKWEQYQQFNASAVSSNILGFTPDMSEYSSEIELIGTVWDKYYPMLMTGSIDVDIYLPQFIEELHSAGIEEVRQEMQRQLDEWKAEQ